MTSVDDRAERSEVEGAADKFTGVDLKLTLINNKNLVTLSALKKSDSLVNTRLVIQATYQAGEVDRVVVQEHMQAPDRYYYPLVIWIDRANRDPVRRKSKRLPQGVFKLEVEGSARSFLQIHPAPGQSEIQLHFVVQELHILLCR